MAKWKSAVITDLGKELMAKVLSGSEIEFTKIKTSDYKYSNDVNLSKVISIPNIKQEKLIDNIEVINKNTVSIYSNFNNKDLTEGYEVRVVGLYAKDPGSDSEILYSLTTTDRPDYLPSFNGVTLSSIDYKFITAVGNAENVILDITDGSTVTQQQFQHLKDDVIFNTDSIDEIKVDVDSIKADVEDLEKVIEDMPSDFHDVPQNSVTEDMAPLEFEHGLTLCSHSNVNGFPSINDYGVSITLRGKNISYAQFFITRHGDIWSRRSATINEWNGEWYSVAKALDEKADLTTIGDLSELITNDKSNLVSAINEVSKNAIIQKYEKPTTHDTDYPVGQLWYSESTRNIYVLDKIDDEGAYWDIFIKSGQVSPKTIYGFIVDENNLNPETAVTYIEDNADFKPAKVSELNSWDNFLKEIATPVLLKDGKVQYKLQHNNYTKKRDGSKATLTGADGDVMVRFNHLWIKEEIIKSNVKKVLISTEPFDGAVSYTKMLEKGYNQLTHSIVLTLQHLYLLIYKDRDCKSALGQGRNDSDLFAKTGHTDEKPFCYGTDDPADQMKFAGLEALWGNKAEFVDGIIVTDDNNLRVGYANFNTKGDGYDIAYHRPELFDGGVECLESTLSNSAGYSPKTIQGATNLGYCAGSYFDKNRVVTFGGSRTDGWQCSIFNYIFGSFSDTSEDTISARLTYVDDDYFYVGAYGGRVINDKLRSVTDVVPTGNETIDNFRKYAQANNR